MATVPGSRSGAGGKIVTNRRRQRLSATPYDRPLPPSPPPKSPNWFTSVILPSARAVASGAGKILSSAIFSDSESSSEDEDSASDEDIDNIIEYESPSNGVNALHEEKVTSAEMMQHGQESQFSVERAETKQLIEQLVMQETFSREERDRLIKVLNSRVMDCSPEAGERRSLANFPGRLLDHEDINVSNKAVPEAKNWFQQKKVSSSSVTELAHGSYNPNSTTSEQVETGLGSPVEVARSYMKERVPWISPTKHVEFRSPLTLRMKLFKEGTPDSVNHDYLSSSMRRNSLTSGSWNTREELRRVRLKATEDMLRTPPAKIDPSLFAVGLTREESIGAGEAVSVIGERMAEPENFWKPKPIDPLMDVGLISDPAPVALESRGDDQAGEAPSSKAAASDSGNNKDSNAMRIDGECATSSPNYARERHSDPHSTDKITGPPATEVAEFGERLYENGLSSSKASSVIRESTNIINGEGNCVLLSEAFMEVPNVTEVDDVTSDSQNSLVEQYEESPHRMTQHFSEEKADLMTGKRGRKSSTNNRRGK